MKVSKELKKILDLMFNKVCSVSAFLKDYVYENDYMTEYFYSNDAPQDWLNLLTIALPNVCCDFPPKLRELPQTQWDNFKQFYEFSSCRMKFMNETGDFFNEIVYELQSYNFMDKLYKNIGDTWLVFLITKCAVFLSIPQSSLLQITGIPIVDKKTSFAANVKRKSITEKAFEPVTDPIVNSFRVSTLNTGSHLADIQRQECFKIEEVIHITIPWSKILFSKCVSVGFPRKHAIEELAVSVNEDSAARLIDIIIDSNVLVSHENDADQGLLMSELKSGKLSQVLKSFLTRHRRCHFLRTLDAHCALIDCAPNISQPLQYVIPKHQVQMFLSAIIHRIIPLGLLGSNHNKIRFQRFCKMFLHLCRSDQLSLTQLMHCMHVSDCKWLPENVSNELQYVLLALVLKWLFCDYLLECLRGCFYITDADVHKKELFYYRKETWKILQEEYLKQAANDGIIRKLTIEQVQNIHNHPSNRICFANGRLLPKKTSMRLVMNFENQNNKKYNLKYLLRNYLDMLKYILRNDPRLKCSGITGQVEFHERWKKFVKMHRIPGKLSCNEPLYFVKLDIQGCFTSIKHNHLETVLKEIVTRDSKRKAASLAVRFCFVYRVIDGRLVRSYTRLTMTEKDSFLFHLENLAVRNKVIVALSRKVVFSKQNVVDNVLAYYRNTFIKFDKSYFQLLQGVAQGNPLSPILCDLYYAHMAAEYFQDFMPPAAERDLLLRYVDDYIYVTTEKDKAIKFCNLMQLGIADYNCNISTGKTITNFERESPSLQDENVNEERVTKIPWFGHLINAITLEVSTNYSCYGNKAIKDCISLTASQGKVGLKKKLIYISGVEKQRILFDGEISSKKCAMRNLYHLTLLCAFRFHSLGKKLPKPDRPHINKEFFYELIICWINQICQSLFQLKNRKKIKYYIRANETKWICLQGFITKLKRHHLIYNHILKLLLVKSNDLEAVIGENRVKRILRTLGPLFPSVFKNIRD